MIKLNNMIDDLDSSSEYDDQPPKENPFKYIDYVDLMSPEQKKIRDEASKIV